MSISYHTNAKIDSLPDKLTGPNVGSVKIWNHSEVRWAYRFFFWELHSKSMYFDIQAVLSYAKFLL
jgi:hypothetical protein